MVSGAARPTSDDALPAGTVVGGRFRLVRVLGTGGMGAVYEADDQRIDRRVAIKILYVVGPKAAQRFEREARAASRIANRYVAAVHDFGRDPAHGLYMVMELLAGETLDALLAREGALSVARAAEIAADIAEALHAAHEAGVVHRDLKPANVMILEDGGLKVLDFGIARLEHDERGATLTAPDTILGTPAYVSPEAVAGRAVGPPADLYGLGVILFEMLAGRRPFVDDVPAVLCTKHLSEKPPRVGDVRGDEQTAALEPLVAALLEKDPALRPARAGDVATALREVAGEAEVAVAVPRRGRSLRVSPLWLGVTAALLLLGIVLGAVLALTGPAPDPTPPAPPPAPEVAPPAPPEVAEVPVAPATVELRVTTTPPDATILLDGEPTASPITLAGDGSEHELTVRARGYREQRLRVAADRDRALDVTLARAPRPPDRPVKLRSW